MSSSIFEFLESCVTRFNTFDFIENDPISVPHRFSKLQDVEITAFWTAIMAWGQRTTIIKKSLELWTLMDNAPHDFIINHTENDRIKLLAFKHRTFQATDTLYFLTFLQHYYTQHSSLEYAFSKHLNDASCPPSVENVEKAIIGFHQDFFSLPDAPQRTRKHISTPLSKSACKRINMFLRWMVRQDKNGVDFGIWKNIRSDQLLIPLDVHVDRQARRLGLLTRPQTDWQAVLELTSILKEFDKNDPVKYDFALFGLGLMEKF